MKPALLDVNVLIALLDAQHVHHRLCQQWLHQHIADGWASCPITLNGCIRIMSQPTYPNAVPLQQVAARLQQAMQTPQHQFWPDDVNPLQGDTMQWQQLLHSRQVTDAYLLALACRHEGRLVTLDRKISLRHVGNSSDDNLHIITP